MFFKYFDSVYYAPAGRELCEVSVHRCIMSFQEQVTQKMLHGIRRKNVSDMHRCLAINAIVLHCIAVSNAIQPFRFLCVIYQFIRTLLYYSTNTSRLEA